MLGGVHSGHLPAASGLAHHPRIETPPGPRVQYGDPSNMGLPEPPAAGPSTVPVGRLGQLRRRGRSEDDASASPTDYYMGDERQRVAALVTLYHQLEDLLPFVRHIWEQLAEPRDHRCMMMGQAAGVGGTGRIALRRLLQQFYNDCEARLAPMELPALSDFGNSGGGIRRLELGRSCVLRAHGRGYRPDRPQIQRDTGRPRARAARQGAGIRGDRGALDVTSLVWSGRMVPGRAPIAR